MNELTFQQILDMLQGGARKFSSGVMGVGETGMRAAGKVNENNFLEGVMGGETNPTVPNLDPVAMRSMVSTNNASGTNPMMMANSIGAGLNSIGLPTNEYSFTEDGNTVGYGFTGDGLTNEAMDAFRNREGITALTPMQLEQEAWLRANQPDSLPAFYKGVKDGIAQYELEEQYRLRM
tara:strand:- start:350 stop:883 length:534 start_codon:yes stop_codon:yes gene_type:complete